MQKDLRIWDLIINASPVLIKTKASDCGINYTFIFLLEIPIIVPIHVPNRTLIATNPSPIPSHPPTTKILYKTKPKQMKLNTNETVYKVFRDTLRDMK